MAGNVSGQIPCGEIRPIAELTPEVASKNWLVFVYGVVKVQEIPTPRCPREEWWWSEPSWWRVEDYSPGCHIQTSYGLDHYDAGRLTHFVILPIPS